MFVACGIWCLADVSSVSLSSAPTKGYSSKRQLNTISHRRQTYHINLVDQTHIYKTALHKISGVTVSERKQDWVIEKGTEQAEISK